MLVVESIFGLRLNFWMKLESCICLKWMQIPYKSQVRKSAILVILSWTWVFLHLNAGCWVHFGFWNKLLNKVGQLRLLQVKATHIQKQNEQECNFSPTLLDVRVCSVSLPSDLKHDSKNLGSVSFCFQTKIVVNVEANYNKHNNLFVCWKENGANLLLIENICAKHDLSG